MAQASMLSTPHILVVDDDERLRSLLQRYLSEAGFRVTTAGDAREARDRMAGLQFDLLVLDLMMPGESGLELTRSLRQSNSVPILLLTAMGDADHRISGFEHGADDYLPKPFEPRELVLRIESILRRAGAGAEPPKQVRFGGFAFDLERGELTRAGEPVRLTSSEAALLKLFCSNAGSTIGRADLLAQTGASNIRAVDVQITRLRRKIEDDPKLPRHLQTVWGRGYVLWPEE